VSFAMTRLCPVPCRRVVVPQYKRDDLWGARSLRTHLGRSGCPLQAAERRLVAAAEMPHFGRGAHRTHAGSLYACTRETPEHLFVAKVTGVLEFEGSGLAAKAVERLRHGNRVDCQRGVDARAKRVTELQKRLHGGAEEVADASPRWSSFWPTCHLRGSNPWAIRTRAMRWLPLSEGWV
jgi:hypothetical protein